MSVFCLFRPGIRPMALETEVVDAFLAKKMLVFAAVRFVTGAASHSESRLVRVLLLALLGLIAVAAKAGIDRIRLLQSGPYRTCR